MSQIGEIMDELYQVVIDRRANPKEGSYTNYLLDKGLDKICKKIGEESAEVSQAAGDLFILLLQKGGILHRSGP